jgi:hypothetical protein
MIKPRGEIRRSRSPKPGLAQYLDVEGIEIAAWSPDPQAIEPCEQVHFILRVIGLDFPFVVRFKSPDTLGFLIQELADYRRAVWPDAEPLDLEPPAPSS